MCRVLILEQAQCICEKTPTILSLSHTMFTGRQVVSLCANMTDAVVVLASSLGKIKFQPDTMLMLFAGYPMG